MVKDTRFDLSSFFTLKCVSTLSEYKFLVFFFRESNLVRDLELDMCFVNAWVPFSVLLG
jgi:hypothetical protein